MQRLLVIGPCGAGKSTLATELGKLLSLPVIHIDQLHWHPGWVEGSAGELRAELLAITEMDQWIIDGNYGDTLAERLERADTVLYLDYPISLCIWRLLRRLLEYRGRTRPDITEGCPERFNLPFLIYLLKWNSGPRVRTEKMLKDFEAKLIRFRSPKALQSWLAGRGQ